MLKTLRKYIGGASRIQEPIQRLLAPFAASPEGKWILGRDDARVLAGFLQEYKPRNILELGGGIGASTAVIASAAPSVSRITSVEQFEKCIRLARGLVPPRLQGKIVFFHSPAHAVRFETISPHLYFSCYRTLPLAEAPFDFAVVDGPGPWEEGGRLVHLPNGDLITLLPHLAPGCKIFIDRRKDAVRLYIRFLSPYIAVVEENKWYALLERTAKSCRSLDDLEVTDADLAALKRDTNYFFK